MSNMVPMMIFLSDGRVENTEEIRESVIAKNQHLQIPIFSIAFGREADFQFLHQISEMNKGFARRVYEDNDATQQVLKLSTEIFQVHNTVFIWCLKNTQGKRYVTSRKYICWKIINKV